LLRYVDDVLFVRAALGEVQRRGGEAFPSFRDRFAEVYARLDEDLRLFETELGAVLWAWLGAKVGTFARPSTRASGPSSTSAARRTSRCSTKRASSSRPTTTSPRSSCATKLRRREQILELLHKRHADDSRRINAS